MTLASVPSTTTCRYPTPPCFDTFLSTFTPCSRCRYHLTFTASEGESKIPQSNRLSFNETRRRSPFFLATVISIGARSLSRFDTFHATFREALRLARQTFLPDAFMFDSELGLGPKSERSAMLYPTYRPTWPSPAMSRAPHIDSAADSNEFEPRLSTLSLKALVLLGLYHGMPDLLTHAWIAGYRFIWPPSMLEYEQMSEEERVTPRGRRCINIARVGIIACLWHSLCVVFRAANERTGALTSLLPTATLTSAISSASWTTHRRSSCTTSKSLARRCTPNPSPTWS